MTLSARFIIGTGRCGSTILSKMIDLHPAVAVLSEMFIALDFDRKLGQRSVSGNELAELIDCGLAAGSGQFKKIVAHLATPEVVFEGGPTQLPDDASAYRDNVFPDAILIPLAHLFEDPARVFDDLITFARAQPDRLLSEQYHVMFDWLTHKAGKQCWIERSGGSIATLAELHELFPDAKFLHLHRNPLDVALSMQRHNHFRLRAFCHYNLATAEGIRWSDLDDADLNNQLPTSPRLQAVLNHPVPLACFLQDIGEAINRGMRAVKHLRPEQYREIRFEDIMDSPAAAMRDIAEFFELDPDPAWETAAAALLKPGQAAHAQPTAEQAALVNRYCGATQALLEQVPPVELYR